LSHAALSARRHPPWQRSRPAASALALSEPAAKKGVRFAAALREVPLVSEQPQPRTPQDSNLSIAIAGVVAVLATIGILYISGMFG